FALVVDDEAFAIGTKVAGTGVAQRPVLAGDKEAVAVDGQVQAVLGVVDIALSKDLGHVVQHHAAALGIAARAQNRGSIDITELGPCSLEADGAGVGDVVTCDIQIGRCRPDTTEPNIERHDQLLLALFGRGYLPIVKTSDRPMLPRPARLRTISPPCPTPRETLSTFAGSSVASWVVSPLMLAWASKRYLPAGKGLPLAS